MSAPLSWFPGVRALTIARLGLPDEHARWAPLAPAFIQGWRLARARRLGAAIPLEGQLLLDVRDPSRPHFILELRFGGPTPERYSVVALEADRPAVLGALAEVPPGLRPFVLLLLDAAVTTLPWLGAFHQRPDQRAQSSADPMPRSFDA